MRSGCLSRGGRPYKIINSNTTTSVDSHQHDTFFIPIAHTVTDHFTTSKIGLFPCNAKEILSCRIGSRPFAEKDTRCLAPPFRRQHNHNCATWFQDGSWTMIIGVNRLFPLFPVVVLLLFLVVVVVASSATSSTAASLVVALSATTLIASLLLLLLFG